MKCPKCNAEIADTAKFCTKCGANIEEANAELAKKVAAEEAKKKAKEEEKKKAEEEKKANDEQKSEAKNEQKNEKGESKNTESKKITEPSKKKSKTSEKKDDDKKSSKTEKSDKESIDKKTEIKEDKEPELEKKTVEDKPKKKKKKHTGLKLIILLIFVLIVLACGSYGLYRIDVLPESIKDVFLPIYEMVDGWLGFEKEDDEKAEDEKENVTENEISVEEDKIKLKDEDEDIVYDYYNKKIAGNEYKIPAINLDYDGIDEINDEIADLVEKDLKRIENVTELPEGSISKTDYRWFQNKNILSLVFFVEGYHVNEYYVYNLDVYTGEEIDDEEILEAEKIDIDEFATMCSEAVEDYYDNYLYSKEIAESAGSVYTQAKSESIDEDNFELSKTNMFLDANGNVNIVAEITTIAGAGYNNFIINIENLKKNNKSIFKDEVSSNKSNSNTTSANTTNETNTANTTNTMNITNTANEI